MPTYLLAGGGTAGHVNPLLAVADELRRRDPDAEVIVLGTAEGLESRLVPQRGYELMTIPKVPFPRRPNRAALSFPADFGRAVRQTRRYLRERSVDAVVGFGGYAAAPAYVAARREKIPYVVHEANAKPGLANVLGTFGAAGVGITFEGTPLRRGVVVGMPLRAELVGADLAASRESAAAAFGLDPERPTLLVFGGSLGAQRLNEAFGDPEHGAWRDVLNAGWQLLLITGERAAVTDPGVAGFAIRPYVDDMVTAFAVADLIVARSGAATVSEISALGIPALYVPYAVGNGEQAKNAAAAVAAGAAVIIPDADLTADRIRSQVLPLLGDTAARDRMRTAAERIGSRTGTQSLIALVDDAVADAS